MSARSIATNVAKACVGAVPLQLVRLVLRSAALAPPAAKTPAFERLCCAVLRNSPPGIDDFWLTNLGIAARLRCKLPRRKDSYIFGRPYNALSERATLALVVELSRDCEDFLDVGANDGIFTFAVNEWAARQIRLHWFEPDAALFDRLTGNLAANGIYAAGNRKAVADRGGTATFFTNLVEDTLGSLLQQTPPGHKTRVEIVDTISLGEYLQGHRIRNSIIKVDVEGAGDSVWRGLRAQASRVQYLVMEIIGPETECRLPQRLISEGELYAYYIRDFELIYCRDGDYRYVTPFWNWLFCRLRPRELTARLRGTSFRVDQ